ncbi:MAG: hypothetical protein CBC09_08235 [Cellvibrionales bacterium TMED49]|nr:MAG: hypothetical protein CBC09_08235 [Cellvibrionales bacterium TMED49]
MLLVAFFGFTTDHFFSLQTLSAIMSQLPALTVVTVGLTLVLIIGGIDLSVGSLVALSACVIGTAIVSHNIPMSLAVLLGIFAGGISGFSSGWLIARFSLPAFIVTLGMLEVARGVAYLSSGSQTVYVGYDIQKLALPIAGIGISLSMMIALFVVATGHFVLTRTIFGRYIIAIGSSESAARISGIQVRPYTIGVLTLSGALAGLGGLFNLAYIGSADPNTGIGLELSAIAAAVIGGTSLMGGRGSIIGAFIGVLIIAVLQNGLAQLGLSEPSKRIITGSVIIFAVLSDRWRRRFNGTYT